jgi:hypothetical protein
MGQLEIFIAKETSSGTSAKTIWQSVYFSILNYLLYDILLLELPYIVLYQTS